MRLVLPFTGSRGDVQPGLALAVELADRGHSVLFGAPPNLVAFATAATNAVDDITVVPFGPDTEELLGSDLVRTRIKSRNPRRRLAALAELANYGWDEMTAQLAAMVDGADATVTGTLGQEMTFNIAEANAIAFVALHYCPIRSNGSMSVLPGRTLPTPINRGAWWLLETVRWRSMKERENRQRRELGLPGTVLPLPERIARYGGTEIQAYESALFPGLEDEWAGRRPFVGFLESRPASASSSTDAEVGTPLREWIDEGAAPVYFGFGSMPVRDPHALLDAIEQACDNGGHRALVSSGWTTLPERLSPGAAVAVTGPLDHATVFPLCRAAVHHGGAGTTAASIRAGLPVMVCWFSADQPFWGAALEQVGAGTSMGFSQLDGRKLADGLEIVTSDRAARKAQELAAAMTLPADAVRAAADIVEDAVRRKNADRTGSHQKR